MLVSEDLFERIHKFTSEKRLWASHYNHGHGVVREYTIAYHLQMNYDGATQPQRYFFKDQGRIPSRFHVYANDYARLREQTPTFIVMCQWVMQKYATEVLKTYRYS